MRIERINEQNILDFEKEHGLDLVVTERSKEYHNPVFKFYARFETTETMDGGLLIGEYGNGNTPEEAIHDYCFRISEKRIVFKAMTDERKEIKVPKLFYKDGEQS